MQAGQSAATASNTISTFQHWLRINTLPEWFMVEPDQNYAVSDLSGGSREIRTGHQLHEGLPVTVRSDEERLLLVVQ